MPAGSEMAGECEKFEEGTAVEETRRDGLLGYHGLVARNTYATSVSCVAPGNAALLVCSGCLRIYLVYI